PHFLYNTLEFINMEVLTGRPENASHMIASLGEYCRISLAYGDNEHTIRRELDQVQAYADIMSCRFSHDVELLTNVPKSLQEKLLPKCTLQPLVENSLRHGFGLSDGGVPFPPKIEITFALQGGYGHHGDRQRPGHRHCPGGKDPAGRPGQKRGPAHRAAQHLRAAAGLLRPGGVPVFLRPLLRK